MNRTPRNLREVAEMYPHLKGQIDTLYRKARKNEIEQVKPTAAVKSPKIKCPTCGSRAFCDFGTNSQGWTDHTCYRNDCLAEFSSHPKLGVAGRNDSVRSVVINNSTSTFAGKLKQAIANKGKKGDEIPSKVVVPNKPQSKQKAKKSLVNESKAPKKIKSKGARKGLLIDKLEENKPSIPVGTATGWIRDATDEELRAQIEALSSKAGEAIGKIAVEIEARSEPNSVDDAEWTKAAPKPQRPTKNVLNADKMVVSEDNGIPAPPMSVQQVMDALPLQDKLALEKVHNERIVNFRKGAQEIGTKEAKEWMDQVNRKLSLLPRSILVRTGPNLLRVKRDMQTNKPYLYQYLRLLEKQGIQFTDEELNHFMDASATEAALRPLSKSWKNQKTGGQPTQKNAQ